MPPALPSTLPAAPPHAVRRLRDACLADEDARARAARLDRLSGDGSPRKPRCLQCRLAPSHCICALRPRVESRAGVCLLMSPAEPPKPSNTGWLVADVVPDTFAFGWSRTAVDPGLLQLLADPQWQPVLVFPGEFAEAARVVHEVPAAAAGALPRRPLFVLLDGTWSEARKMFRKSPYLDGYPVLSLLPGQLKRYRLRRSWHPHHLCTAEVAALCLGLAGDTAAAAAVEAWLDVFSQRYLLARESQPVDEADEVHARLRELATRPAA